MFHCSYDSIEFEFIGRIIPLRTAEGSTEESNRMIQTRIIKSLLENCSKSRATIISLKNKIAFRVRKYDDLRYQQFFIQLVELYLEFWSPINIVRS